MSGDDGQVLEPRPREAIASSRGGTLRFGTMCEEALRIAEAVPDVMEITSGTDGESESAPVAGNSVDSQGGSASVVGNSWGSQGEQDGIPALLLQPAQAGTAPAKPEAQPRATAPRATWTPGRDCIGFIDRQNEAPVECGVLVANATEVLRGALQKDTRPGAPNDHIQGAATVQLLVALLSRLQEIRGSSAPSSSPRGLPVEFVAELLRLSPGQVQSMGKEARRAAQNRAMPQKKRSKGKKTRNAAQNRAKPQREHEAGQGEGRSEEKEPAKPRVTLRTMVRIALGNAAKGRPRRDFSHSMAQLQLAGMEVGTKYLNVHFPSAVEHVGGLAVSNLAAQFVNAALPGLGIPSDIELFFDPGTIGRVFRAVRSTVMVIGITISDPSSEDGARAILVGAPPVSVNAKELEYEAFEKFLERSPMQLHRRALRARMAVSSTDGAYVEGEGSHHKATHLLLGHLWEDMGLSPKKTWDEFHRWNKVQGRAVKAVALAAGFLQLTRDIDNVLGFGQGRLIDKQVAAFSGEQWLAGKAPGGTREFVYAAGIPDRFLAKWAQTYRAVDLRRDHAEEGRTGHDRHWWVALGIRLASPSMLVFAVVLADAYTVMTPHVLRVQKPGLLPDVRARGLEHVITGLQAQRRAMGRLLPWIDLLPMVARYLGGTVGRNGRAVSVPNGIAKDITVFVSTLLGRHLRRLPRMLGEMIGNGEWQGRRVCLDAREPAFGSIWVHHACQCISMKRAGHPDVTREDVGKAFGAQQGAGPTGVECRAAPVGPAAGKAGGGKARFLRSSSRQEPAACGIQPMCGLLLAKSLRGGRPAVERTPHHRQVSPAAPWAQ